jgi:hypothetical protein
MPCSIYLLNCHLFKLQQIMIMARPQYTHTKQYCVMLLLLYAKIVPMSFMQKRVEIISNYLYKFM